VSKPHIPTKACPHRWCRTVHRIAAVEGGLAIVALAIRQPWFLLILSAMAVLSTALYATAARKTLHDLAADELTPIVPLAVRRGWALTAVGIDIAVAVVAPLAIAAAAVSEPGSYATKVASGGPMPIVVTVAFAVFHQLAHHLATRPAKPQRVLAPTSN